METQSPSKLNLLIKANEIEKLLIKLQLPGLKQKVSFFRLMAISQNAKLWIRNSVSFILETENHPWMRKILKDILDQIWQWISLEQAMRNHPYFFSPEEIELIKSSEVIWNLPEVLENIASELENFQKLTSKVKNALMYPLFILFFSIIAVVILLIYVIPTIVEMFPNKDTLPWITKFMLALSSFLQNSRWKLIVWIVLWIVLIKFLISKLTMFKQAIDNIVLKLPVIKWIIRKFYLYRFCKLLWDFYDAWVSPNTALWLIWDLMQNSHYKKKMYDIKSDIEFWIAFSESIEWSRLFDPLLIQIVAVWENTWEIWSVLQRIAWFYREELDNELEWLMKLIEPALMMFVAIIVWLIVASIFLPMGDLIWNIWS